MHHATVVNTIDRAPPQILCAVDFSAPCRDAMAMAAERARATGARLVLLHVYQVPTHVFVGGPGAVVESLTRLRLHAEHELELWRRDALRHGAREVDTHLAEGVPWHEIVREADELGCELIVLGARGHSRIAHALIGSVAERVVRHAHCSVLIARASGSAG